MSAHAVLLTAIDSQASLQSTEGFFDFLASFVESDCLLHAPKHSVADKEAVFSPEDLHFHPIFQATLGVAVTLRNDLGDTGFSKLTVVSEAHDRWPA